MSNRIETQEKQWRREDDLRTLKQADEIRRDKERMKGAETELQKQMKALSTLSNQDFANLKERLLADG